MREQHYRLASWRVSGAETNYRRFFDVNDLAAIRAEDSAVFEDTHRLVREFVALKREEHTAYSRHVSDWELRHYATAF